MPSPEPSIDRRDVPDGASARALGELEEELNRLQRAIRMAIQNQLGKLAGQCMGSLGENRHLADSIHQLLESHGLRVQCIECGHPAILRVSPRGQSGNGAFVFDHSIDGRRTFHGGKGCVPEIRLVAKPPRRKRQKAATEPGTVAGIQGKAPKKAAS